MSMNSTPVLKRMSLRRAIWRARMTARAIRDSAELSGPERHATELLRSSVRQHLKSVPVGSFADVYLVEDDWRSQVLQRDPEVVCARSAADVREALEGDDPVAVFATREAHLTVDRLRELCRGNMQGKTLFIES